MSSRFAPWAVFVVAVMLAGCFGSRSLDIDETEADPSALTEDARAPDPDGAIDRAAPQGRVDAMPDDAMPDVSVDAGPEGGAIEDAAVDAPPDGGAEVDAAPDASVDAGSDAGPPPALTALGASAGALSPAFSPSTHAYGLTVAPWLEAVVLVPGAAPGETVRVDGALVPPGSASSPITVLSGKVVSVTVQVGDRTTAYAVTFIRAADTSTYVKASQPAAGDGFGNAVGLSGDTLAVGAWNRSNAAGAVYIYSKASGAWQPTAYLEASNAAAGDRFGEALALDGDTLVVGARFEDGPGDGASNSGAAYVFRNVEGTWTEEAYLKPSSSVAAAEFGNAVAIAGDRIAVGALRRNSSAGAAYVFHRTGPGIWTEEKAFVGAEVNDGFGISVAIDGARLVVGARHSSAAASKAGAAYVYVRSGTDWAEETVLKAPNARAVPIGTIAFGSRVRIAGDLAAVADPFEYGGGSGIGANMNDTSVKESGAVYLYRRIGGVWTFESYVKASNSSVTLRFGGELALEPDRLVVATSLESEGGDFFSGAAYSFRRVAGVWFQEAKLKTTGTRMYDYFGSSVALSGGTLVCGAGGEDSASVGVGGDRLSEALADSGAAFLFP